MGVLDIKKAFDNVTVEMIIKAMGYLKFPASLILAVVEPLASNVAVFEFQGVCSEQIEYNKVVRTGGKEGPALFNIVLEAIWGQLVKTWEQMGYGIKLEGNGTDKALINHFLWADNVKLLAANSHQLSQMVAMMTVTLRRAGMDWKKESLQYAIFGLGEGQGPSELKCPLTQPVCELAGDPGLPKPLRTMVTLPRCQECEILGVKISATPKGYVTIDHRLEAGRRAFYADGKFYRSRAISLKEKFRQYQSKVQQVVGHGCVGWNCNEEVLDKLKKFEGRCLNMMRGLHKRNNETWEDFRERTTKKSFEYFKEHGHKTLVERIVRANFDFAMEVSKYYCDGQHRDEISKATRQTMRCMLHAAGDWTQERDAYLKTLSQCPFKMTGTRRLKGRPSRIYDGWHALFGRWWHTPTWHECMIRPQDWWSLANFLSTADPKMSNMFILMADGPPPGDRPPEPSEEKLAKRLAKVASTEDTVWDEGTTNISVEMCGDSQTVVQWMRGKWACDNMGYLKRVQTIQNMMCEMSDEHNVSCPCFGRDPWKHIYRELNKYADELTWNARNGRCERWYDTQYVHYNKNYIRHIRGCWDGGVSEIGSGVGCWVEISAGGNDPWHCVFHESYLLPFGSTVTEAELNACERLFKAVRQIVVDISSSKRRRRI